MEPNGIRKNFKTYGSSIDSRKLTNGELKNSTMKRKTHLKHNTFHQTPCE